MVLSTEIWSANETFNSCYISDCLNNESNSNYFLSSDVRCSANFLQSIKKEKA